MRFYLGLSLLIISIALAIYNVSRNERKEITGPSLSLILSAFVGFALLLDLNFNLLGFDSSQLDKKIEQANEAKESAVAAKNLAEKALWNANETNALILLRTGLLQDERTIRKNYQIARDLLKSTYGDKYTKKIEELKKDQFIPSDFKP